MSSSFLLVIVDHPQHGPVAISTSNRIDLMVHLPHESDFFEPFGRNKINEGKILPTNHSLWQVSNPKIGQKIRLKNTITGQTATYTVLFVGTNLAIDISSSAKLIMERYASELVNASQFTSTRELDAYSEAIKTFFESAIANGYDQRHHFVLERDFNERLKVSPDILSDLNNVTLMFRSSGLVRLDVAMWYLIIYKINTLHHMKPPFPFKM